MKQDTHQEYLVTLTKTINLSTTVTADSLEEALEMAHQVNDDDFPGLDSSGSWVVTDVKKEL